MVFIQALLRQPAKAKSVAQSSGDNPSSSSSAEKYRKGTSAFITDEICSVILDISLQRMIKKSSVSGDVLELWSDELEGKGDFGQYRSRLVTFVTYLQKDPVQFTHLKFRFSSNTLQEAFNFIYSIFFAQVSSKFLFMITLQNNLAK